MDHQAVRSDDDLDGARPPSGVAAAEHELRTGGDERLRAERTLMAAVLTWRATGLATGLSAVLTGRDQFRHRGVAVAHLGAATAESLWLAVRLFRRDRWTDRVGAGAEIGAAVAALAIGRANLDPVHRGTWFNWAPWSFAASAVCGQAMANHPLDVAASGAVAIIAAMVLPGPKLGDAVANSFALGSFFVCSRFLANQIRQDASRTEDARAEVMAEGASLAREHERLVQLRVLHDSAVQALESIGTGRVADGASVRRVVRAEAGRLREELGVGGVVEPLTEANDLRRGVEALVDDRSGPLHVDVRFAALPEVSAEVVRALVQACGEALTNVAKHAGTDRATIAVSARTVPVCRRSSRMLAAASIRPRCGSASGSPPRSDPGCTTWAVDRRSLPRPGSAPP